MFYVHVDPETGATRYPFTLTDFRRENPQVLMRANPDPESLAGHGIFPVTPAEPPEADISKNLTRSAEMVDGEWTEVWTATDADTEVVAERLASRQAAETERRAALAVQAAEMLDALGDAIAGITDEVAKAAALERFAAISTGTAPAGGRDGSLAEALQAAPVGRSKLNQP